MEANGVTNDAEARLTRFRKLIHELELGLTERNTFQPWEVELLLDIHDCELPRARRAALLKRYGKAVERQMENGGLTPMKLSEYLKRKEH